MKIDQLQRQVFYEAGGLQDRDKSSSTGSRREPFDKSYQKHLDGEDSNAYWERMAGYEKEHGITPEMLSGGMRWATPRSCEWKGNGPNSKQQGLCNQVKPKESWATPNTLDHLACRTPEGVLKQATVARKGRMKPANLREQVDPATCEIYKRANWPTPNMPSGGPKADGSAIVGMNGGPGHREVIKKHFGAGVKLNPDWVCTLMGIPVGWVSVNDEGENQIDELRLLGNGVVPETAEKAFCHLTQEIINGNV